MTRNPDRRRRKGRPSRSGPLQALVLPWGYDDVPPPAGFGFLRGGLFPLGRCGIFGGLAGGG